MQNSSFANDPNKLRTDSMRRGDQLKPCFDHVERLDCEALCYPSIRARDEELVRIQILAWHYPEAPTLNVASYP